ncbi:TerB family tellurite resistance protein [Lichenihabitans sp. Uapishka_5]|uniref:TerB family tellurite resistance protein n=1 Tax=Lichenihabitans sp. Uapishka_5 TaxID=3037302 RepID=UPI0029E82605|nr:TerB family tellurite resistance protein [Lichenihabitans sp. Uapishka_5]MDX7953054.1 TerB family tellurite resistance protein [Lichenihabitans sp. Uapishka_5]
MPTPRIARVDEAELFLEALVAAYALMAHADGEFAASERRCLLSIVCDTPALDTITRDDAEALADRYEAHFNIDPESAEHAAWERLDLIVGHRRAVDVLVAACRELIAADGIGHPAEYRMLAAIMMRLGVAGSAQHA